MDRAEATGLCIATVGHVALLGALSLGFAGAMKPPVSAPPIEISFVEDIGLQSASPDPTVEPAAATIAPELGPPDEAAPQAEQTPAPPEPTPLPKAAEAKPEPQPRPRPSQKAAPAKSAPAKAEPKAQPKPATKGKAEKSSGTRLGKDFLKGIGNDPKSKSNKAPAAELSAQSLASIQAAIQRQIQPCADRQVNPGPGANQITVRLNIRLNRNGSLARQPTVMGTDGVTDSNERYEQRVKDLAIAAYKGCSPLRGLPEELYSTPKGGWSNLVMKYSLPG